MTFNILGIKLEITFLFTALIAFVVSLKAPANVLLTIISSLLHETGHLIAMTLFGNKPKAIRLEITGMNIIRNTDTKISVKNEILIGLGGPAINLIIFVLCSLILCFYNNENVLIFGCINLILMTFNLLPIKQLDGGLALYYFLSQYLDNHICGKILKITSIIFISLILLWGIYVFISTKFNISLIIIALFLTLSLFSNNEY